MQWWAWIAVGAILLGAELSFVDAQFYLVFVGAAALCVGGTTLAVPALAVWVQWSMFTALAAFAMISFRRRIYDRLRRNLPVMQSGPTGAIVTLPAALPPGATCRVDYGGSSWDAVNGGAATILAGASARVERVDGLTLVVHGLQ